MDKARSIDKTPGIKGDTLKAVFNEVKSAVDKIRARGGSVVFVRPPSNGGYLETEKIVYPRELYWDAMLAYVDAPGIHYTDYPQTANFVCVEWSHLSPKDAENVYEATGKNSSRRKGLDISQAIRLYF